MRRISRHLTYANVAATLALVLAMTGGAIAATGGFTSGGKLQGCVGGGGALKLLKSGQKCRHGQQKVVWNQAGPRGPAGPSGLAGQTGTSPTIPGKVTSAETALTANNALSLGGVPASDFTHRDCASLTGQIKGFATIQASPSFPSKFTTIPSTYSCSGEAVEVMRIVKGVYEVRFVGNPAAVAVATVAQNAGAELIPASASVEFLTNGEWWVDVYDLGAKEQADLPFSMILP